MLHKSVFDGSPSEFADVVWDYSKALIQNEGRLHPAFFDGDGDYVKPCVAVGAYRVVIRFRNEPEQETVFGWRLPLNPATGVISAKRMPSGKTHLLVEDDDRPELKELWEQCYLWLVDNKWVPVPPGGSSVEGGSQPAPTGRVSPRGARKKWIADRQKQVEKLAGEFTIAEIAIKSNVSKSTVNRDLKELGYVNPRKRKGG